MSELKPITRKEQFYENIIKSASGGGGGGGTGLPDVTDADDGAVLKVIDGAWGVGSEYRVLNMPLDMNVKMSNLLQSFVASAIVKGGLTQSYARYDTLSAEEIAFFAELSSCFNGYIIPFVSISGFNYVFVPSAINPNSIHMHTAGDIGNNILISATLEITANHIVGEEDMPPSSYSIAITGMASMTS